MYKNIYEESQMQNSKVDIAKRKSDKNENICLHSHEFYELIFVKNGCAKYIIGSKTYIVKKGNLIIIPPKIIHKIIFCNDMTYYERYIIWINANFYNKIKAIFNNIGFAIDTCMNNQQYLIVPHNASVKGLELGILRIYEEFLEKQFNWEECLTSLVLCLLTHINRTLYNLQYHNYKEQQENELEEILNFIDSNLEKHINVKNIAKHINKSSSNVHYIFKTKLNIAPYQFILKRRLVYGKNQILANVPFNIICQNVGFTDYAAFYRAFKKEFGMSPSKFKEQYFTNNT